MSQKGSDLTPTSVGGVKTVRAVVLATERGVLSYSPQEQVIGVDRVRVREPRVPISLGEDTLNLLDVREVDVVTRVANRGPATSDPGVRPRHGAISDSVVDS